MLFIKRLREFLNPEIEITQKEPQEIPAGEKNIITTEDIISTIDFKDLSKESIHIIYESGVPYESRILSIQIKSIESIYISTEISRVGVVGYYNSIIIKSTNTNYKIFYGKYDSSFIDDYKLLANLNMESVILIKRPFITYI